MIFKKYFVVLVMCCFVHIANAGVFQDSLFRSSSSVVNIINQDSLKLSVRQWVLAKIGAIRHPNDPTTRKCAPDIVGYDSSFSFFWADSTPSNPTKNIVYRKDMRITRTGFDTSANIRSLYSLADVHVNFLHAKKSPTMFFITFIDSNLKKLESVADSFPALVMKKASGGNNQANCASSQCYWKNGKFLDVFQKDHLAIYVRPLFFASNAVNVNTVFPDSVVRLAPALYNPSIAADPLGNFMVQWLEGLPSTTRYLNCMFYSSDGSKRDSVIHFNSPVESLNMGNFYDAAPIVGYDVRTFGTVFWDGSGIWFRSLKVDANTGKPVTVAIDSLQLSSLSTARYPTISTNGRYIAAAWITDTVWGSTRVRVSGVRDTVKPGYMPFSNEMNKVYFKDSWIPCTMNPGHAGANASTDFALNCALDSLGNIGATWNLDDSVYAGLWAYRGVRDLSGAWESNSTRFLTNNTDSSNFLPGSVIFGEEGNQVTNDDSLRVYVRVGADSADTSKWKPWTLVNGDSSVLAKNTNGINQFFRYRVNLYRGQDTCGTPVIKKCGLRWNAQPTFLPLDSLYVNNRKKLAKSFSGKDTCFSRSDTVKVFFTVNDNDSSDTVFTSVRSSPFLLDSLDTLTDAFDRSTNVKLLPQPKSDTTITLLFTARDKTGWNATQKQFTMRTRNSLPILRVKAILDTNLDKKNDTLLITSKKSFTIQQNDSIEIMYSCKDTNDYLPQFQAFTYVNRNKVDSTQQDIDKKFIFKASSGRPMGDTIVVTFADPEKSVSDTIILRVNHFPKITTVTVKENTMYNNDTISLGIGSLLAVSVIATDSDASTWDKLLYHFITNTKDSTSSSESYSQVVTRLDSTVLVAVTDSYGAKDSLRFFIKSPYFAIDTSVNKPYGIAKAKLKDSVATIVGSRVIDSVKVPIINTGNDTLLVTSIKFKGDTTSWIKVRTPSQNGGTFTVYDSLVSGIIDTFRVAPKATAFITVLLDVSHLSGDGIKRDTVIIQTNDFSHQYDTLPVKMEYNDLPKIAKINISFTKGKPNPLAKKSGTLKANYVFPPHAQIAILFSEGMDTSRASQAIKAYSAFEARVATPPPAIELDRTWSRGDSLLLLTPRYTAPSKFYNNFLPPPQFFIPGDSIKLIVSSLLTDKATTPHGPNGIDVHQNSIRAANADTIIPFRVDSITFSLDSIYPAQSDTGIPAGTSIVLKFSSPPLSGTIDTSKTNNRCLTVWSQYAGIIPITYSAITIAGKTVTFTPSKLFYYGDKINCYYHARWAKDSLGYSIDKNKNGIPMSLFDTLSNEDDVSWFFGVKNIVRTGVMPKNQEVNVGCKTPVVITFSDSISVANIDTSRINNNAFSLTSSMSKGATIAFDSVKLQKNMLYFYTSKRFYYGDTVFCSFKGLMTSDTSKYSIDLNGKKLFTISDTLNWYYIIRENKIVKTEPDSASASLSPQPLVSLKFSDPIFPNTFDFDTSRANRSFSMRSVFGSDSGMSFKSITVSQDSTQVFVKPNMVIFSGDTVLCNFKGFTKQYAYSAASNLPTDSTATKTTHSWFFTVGDIGFYTFPNPYKPGSDSRHCGALGAPCGIWFTNLHTVKNGVNEVIIKILGMNANPVFSTKMANIPIRFSQSDRAQKPQWKWDTKNQRGEFVASGLYFYVITDVNDKVLAKGKLLIVR